MSESAVAIYRKHNQWCSYEKESKEKAHIGILSVVDAQLLLDRAFQWRDGA